MSGLGVTLDWSNPLTGNPPTTFHIEAGSAPSLANVYSAPTGGVSTHLAVSAPPGTYFVRIRAANACGLSSASNEQQIVVGQGPVACTFALTPTEAAFSGTGESLSVLVSTQPLCEWTATRDHEWLGFTGPSTGTGPARITVDAQPNASTPRAGRVNVGPATLTVLQGAATSPPPPPPPPPTPPPPPPTCSYNVVPPTQNALASGGSFGVQITTATGCAWQAAADTPWLTFSSASSGSGSATVQYTVLSNSSTGQRFGHITVTGTSVTPQQNHITTVSQSAATPTPAPCDYTASPSIIPAGGGSFDVDIVTTQGCVWVASLTQPWVAIAGSNSSSQTAAIRLAVNANISLQARSDTLTLLTPTGTRQFSISQSAATPAPLVAAFSVTPTICTATPLGTYACTFNGTVSSPQADIVEYKWIIAGTEYTGAVLTNPITPSTDPVVSGYYTRDVSLTIRTASGTQASTSRAVTFFRAGSPQGLTCGVNSDPAMVSAQGGTFEFTFSIVENTTCTKTPWYPAVLAPTSSWISVISPTSGMTTGTVRYTVAPNTTGTPRTGVIRVFYAQGSDLYTVTQSQ